MRYFQLLRGASPDIFVTNPSAMQPRGLSPDIFELKVKGYRLKVIGYRL